jgi:spore maturation protein SpmA
MAMFLAINTSAITLIPFTIIGYRAAADSKDPASVVAAMILATTCSTIVAIASCRLFQRFYPMPFRPLPVKEDPNGKGAVERDSQTNNSTEEDE